MNDLFDGELSPAQQWSDDVKKKALDELFSCTTQYSTAENYLDLLNFVTRFKRYSPFNAMLVHTQKPGARYVLRAVEWDEKYGRTILTGAQPLVALQPMGPIMFLFDVSDTEGAPLPPEIESPFEVRKGEVHGQLEATLHNCARDGIRIHDVSYGSQMGGSIQAADNPGGVKTVMFRNEPVRLCYEMTINKTACREVRFATLAHELGHLYCGHQGTPNPKWWPDRRGLDKQTREFEAESVAYLVCKRLGIDTPSDKYLNGYLHENKNIPNISLDRVFAASGLIERMGKRTLASRKL